MSLRNKMAAGLLKLGFGEFEAPLGGPVFGSDRQQKPVRTGLKPENRREDPPLPPMSPSPAGVVAPAAPPADPKAPLDPLVGMISQEVNKPLPHMGEVGRYFRSLFTKEQK